MPAAVAKVSASKKVPAAAAVGQPEVEAARAARLRHVSDEEPGYVRRRRGRGFTYRDWKGRTVSDVELRRRFAALAIPPAWTDVWICRYANGHLQATGRDDAGRKQYVYHPRWRAARDRAKFDRMIAFARVLPKIRSRVNADLELDGLPRGKVLAAVVHLLETTLARVGNAGYAKRNDSFGLTTLRKKHVDGDGEREPLAPEFSTEPRKRSARHRSVAKPPAAVSLQFNGKGGKPWRVEVEDPRVAEVIEDCLETPGYELFKYLDDDGVRRDVTSDDVNAYLREAAGADVTAKDFRTWAGTVLAAAALAEVEAATANENGGKAAAAKENGRKAATAAAAKENGRIAATAATAKENGRKVAAVVKQVADELGNTPAVCRQAYIHPEILDGAGNGGLELAAPARRVSGLRPEESRVLAYLEAAAARDGGP